MNKNLSYAESIREAFNFILKNFSESFVIGQGLWSPWYVGSTMKGLPKKFGKKRIIDSPVSEAAVTGIATGASLHDMKPIVVHPRMDFMLLAADAIINQSAKWKFMLGGANSPNVTIRSIINRGGEQGAQHSQSLYSMFANIPGVIVVLPSNPQDAFNLLVKSVITRSTVIYIDDRWLYSETDKIKIENKILKKNLLNEEPEIIKQGEDLTIISLGYGVKISKEVSTMLNKKIKSEIIDLRIINPLRPKKLINSAIKTKRVVVLDYGWSNCGIASEVVSQIAEKTDKEKVKIRYLKITLPSMPAPTNKINEKEYYISSKEVLKSSQTFFLMKIWFVNPGEPLPIDNNQRLFRTGKIAERLKLNHEIIWFSSKFDHFKKEFRDEDQFESNGIKYYFIKSIGYKNNLSIRRVFDHVIMSVNLFIKALTLKKPDVVISAYPPIETSFLIMIYCKLRKIKFICDVRDLWPYTFVHLFKNKFKIILCKILIFPWVLLAKTIFKNSQLITISDGFQNWLVKYSKNTNIEKFYLSYEKKQISKTKKFKDLEIKDDDFIISFVGNFSEIKFNFSFIFDCSNEIYSLSKNIKFVFCGDFKNLEEKNKFNFKNIFFYDWIDRDELRELLNISNLGLAPYNDLWDFNLSIPNKISEYLCYELPILTSLKGDTENLINQYNCGISYSSNEKNQFIQIIKNLYFDKEKYAKIKKGAIKASSKFYDDEVLRDMEKNILN